MIARSGAPGADQVAEEMAAPDPERAPTVGAGPAERDADRRASTRLRLGAAQGLARAAGGARDVAGRADRAGGTVRRTAPGARRAARRLDAAAAYLRAKEAREIAGDLEAMIRRHPLKSLAGAFLTGYLARRIF